MKMKKNNTKKNLTIREYVKMVEDEWRGLEFTGLDTFQEWLHERSGRDRKAYGVYFDYDTEEYLYSIDNANCPGEDICVSCFKQCEADEIGLCPKCAEEQMGHDDDD